MNEAARNLQGERQVKPRFTGDYDGYQRSIRTQLEDADARGESPRIVVDGFNVE